MTATVGIVLPVYNAQNTLEEAISSILAQTYQDFLLIIVNDGSTDDSSKLIEAMLKRDARILSLEHPNRGAGYTRNRGIDLAADKGMSYVAFLDADDVWLPEKLEYQIRAMDMEQNIDIVITEMINYDDFRKPADQKILSPLFLDIPDIFESLCLNNFTFQPATSLIKTNLFLNLMRYSESPHDKVGEDYLPFLYFAFFGARFVRIPSPLYRERRLSGSLQRSTPGYVGSGARVRAIRRLRGEYGASPLMTPHRARILEAAEDRYRTWILASARASSSYGQAIRESLDQFSNFHNKYFFFREFIKACVYRSYANLFRDR